MANLDLSGEYVDEIRINMEGRSFEIYGSDGSCQKVTCEDTDQFMAVFERSFLICVTLKRKLIF